VTGRYTISNNPKWYQDFYAQNGRKPSDKELRDLAEIHVKNGFADEGGGLPAWQPSKVQEIDSQIDEIKTILREQPEQGAALRPILQALEEDKQMALRSADSVGQYQSLSQEADAIRQALSSSKRTAAAAERVTQGSEPTSPIRSTKLEDIVKEHGFNDVTPETIAQSFNNKKWYHGTGSSDLTTDTLDPFVGDHQSLFGHGIYLTDEPSIASGYAKSRSKRSKTPTVYESNVKMDRVLDIEQPITKEAKEALLKTTKALDYQYKEETRVETPHFSNLINEMSDSGATTEQIIQKLRSEVSDFSRENGISTNEFVEAFQDLAIYLKQGGYDGITHTGGGRNRTRSTPSINCPGPE